MGSSSPVPSSVYDGDNVGENKLISCLSLLEVPYKFTLTQRMEEIRIELGIIEKFGAYVYVNLVSLHTKRCCNNHVNVRFTSYLFTFVHS
jgi:hypothetical protein